MGRNLLARAVSSANQGPARPLSPVAPVRRQRRRTSGALLRPLDLGETPVGECTLLSSFNCFAFVVCVVRPSLFLAGDRGGPELGHRAGTVASRSWAGGGTHLPLSDRLLVLAPRVTVRYAVARTSWEHVRNFFFPNFKTYGLGGLCSAWRDSDLLYLRKGLFPEPSFVSHLQNGYRAFIKQMFSKRLICARGTKDPHLLEVTALY